MNLSFLCTHSSLRIFGLASIFHITRYILWNLLWMSYWGWRCVSLLCDRQGHGVEEAQGRRCCWKQRWQVRLQSNEMYRWKACQVQGHLVHCCLKLLSTWWWWHMNRIQTIHWRYRSCRKRSSHFLLRHFPEGTWNLLLQEEANVGSGLLQWIEKVCR